MSIKDRTKINLIPVKDVGQYSKFKGTINPNIAFPDPTTYDCVAFAHKLKKLTNYFLSDAGLRRIVKFKDGSNDWDRVLSIPEDRRFARIEWGDKRNCVHAHFTVVLIHDSPKATDIQLNIPVMEDICQSILETGKKVYIHIEAGGKDWEDYVRKYDDQ